ncbi:MAG TPA: neutral/alkaline non-lysosomal ceramidase N-terminal domain-containing protein [Phycisphaerae bacterium]|jgi:hypothetical protein|nr:neutral/alkaline non-lysosomal ceramidase N-terminal domain-containing protein [Phycisphaerae bacterium]HOL25530.1 neutral/alkaline non-lysosomal ceramidase N-terminal domain-containing protein [Phycisphaerae bacterium]HPP22277.1 neutral/alkaline non-lysosomal ceramidase N-terminal domain-containing protein [Phycisphaerae bacterium]HPU34732.1 neutral/alkaline non-lysosomal ceramidase N-terminal domain-containing protein [Phycisphaerae bacterium]HQA45667.1 neutral/alkaline non-lysosomal ceram
MKTTAGMILVTLICSSLLLGDQPGSPSSATDKPQATYPVGVARVDITPEYPIRLTGYGGRRNESDGILQRLWAKALAIGSDETGPAVLVTVENCGVPANVTEEVAKRLGKKARIPRERFVVCSSHIHTGPCLFGTLPTMFGEPYPPDHKERIDRYTREITDHIERVALAALADRRPAHLAWAQGRVEFAVNRRAIQDNKYAGFGVNPAGPVDHAMPMLRVTDTNGKLRAILVNYACHCTTFGPETNKLSGDWAGFAQEYVERDHPGAVCLVSIGCGADANPHPRVGIDPDPLKVAKQHGQAIAAEVNRLLKGSLRPISSLPICRLERINLPFDRIPTRQEWEKLAKDPRHDVAYHAQHQIAKLDRGESLPTELSYPVQTWAFGNELAMVFMAGEVVVDYSLTLKKKFDPDRLWVTGYANDVPCYIPSRRILAEGGYEAEGAMIYYDQPTRLKPEVENLILDTVRRQMPAGFAAGETK